MSSIPYFGCSLDLILTRISFCAVSYLLTGCQPLGDPPLWELLDSPNLMMQLRIAIPRTRWLGPPTVAKARLQTYLPWWVRQLLVTGPRLPRWSLRWR
jgi:hypothetical protein